MIFIGGINIGNQPRGGQEGKNQVLLEYLLKVNPQTKVIDSFNWKVKLPIILSKIMKYCAFASNEKIIISLSSDSALYIVKLFNLLGVTKRNEVHYLVVGGVFHEWIKDKNLNDFKDFKGIYPESIQTCEALQKMGLKNIVHLPNFRKIVPVSKPIESNNPPRFVFFSRIIESKGCQLIFEAIRQLQQELGEKCCEVDFYGPLDEAYQAQFEAELKKQTGITYKGYLNLSQSAGYQQLSTYDAMLFPTFYEGEGYPGVIIDALIAEVPIIASDWHCNTELVQNEVNGLVIQPKSVDSLAKAIKNCIQNPDLVQEITQGAAQTKTKYDVEKLISKTII